VDTDNPVNSNHDKNNDGISAGQGDEEALADVSLSEENVNKEFPTSLKKLSDDTGALPPIIQSRTRQQAKETGVMTGAEAIKTVAKKQRKFRKELQIGLLKREEEENEKKLRNKLRNEKNKYESRKKRGFHPIWLHLR
jgi:hypothetical protein